MPSLTASAFKPLPSLSKDARHIAHCAVEEREKKKKARIKIRGFKLKHLCFLLSIIDSLVRIIRGNHQVNHYTGNRYIQPNWKRNLSNFSMSVKILS